MRFWTAATHLPKGAKTYAESSGGYSRLRAVRLATISGRYMPWTRQALDRVEKSYNAIVDASGPPL